MVLVVNAAASPLGAGASPRFDSLVTKATKNRHSAEQKRGDVGIRARSCDN